MFVENDISTIFFDLDHTLWDFEKNAYETLIELCQKYEVCKNQNFTPDDFIEKYNFINNKYWELYSKGKMKREHLRYKRFDDSLKFLGIKNEWMSKALADDYILISPLKNNLHDNALLVLNYLKTKYKLYIITNGFNEVQFLKIKHSGLTDFFSSVITSEIAGYQKPDKRIFEYALKIANCKASDCMMIGDSFEADILGANDAGIKPIYFNPVKNNMNKHSFIEINNLIELQKLL
jgi:putative hydrolase of the HAD superfamily